jgi:hypothetical protein
MAKSKGNQGSFTRPKLASSASLFEKRGDKWGGGSRPQPLPHNPTKAEQDIDAALKSLGPTGQQSLQYAAEIAARLKHANAEDPDMDCWTKAGRAKDKQEYKQAPGTPVEITMRKQIASVCRNPSSSKLIRSNPGILRQPVHRVDSNKGLGNVPTTDFDQAVLIEHGNIKEARVRLLAEKESSREKARKLLEEERKAEIARRADYMSSRLGKK